MSAVELLMALGHLNGILGTYGRRTVVVLSADGETWHTDEHELEKASGAATMPLQDVPLRLAHLESDDHGDLVSCILKRRLEQGR